jgi:5-methylthioadenosine/S-adenosylhomocysteine deaminase
VSEIHYDLLIRNATLLTAEPDSPIVRNAGLGVIGGRIAWLGTGSPPDARGVVDLDLEGRVITPGFVNVHTHSALSMVRGVAADLGFAPSYTKGLPNALDLTPDDAIAMTRLGALEALLAGSTLVGEHFVHVDACVPELAKLGLRVHASVRLHDVDFRKVADSGRWEFDATLGDGLLERNLALHSAWDGREGGRVRVQFAAHAADTCSEPYLRRVAQEAQKRGAVVNTHLAQSRVEVERVMARTGRSPVEVFEEAGLLNGRLLCGHCIYVGDVDIERMAGASANVVHIPKCNAASGRFAPTPKLMAAGLNLALATDTQHADMVESMRWALATARVQEGRVGEDWQPHHVFEMATINGAQALGLADELGSLKVGKKADLVVFDFRRPHLVPATNPLGNLVHTALGRDVEMVFVDGRCVVRDGRPTLVDIDAVLADARRTARDLWRKAAA